MIFKTFPMDRDTRNPRTGQPVRAPLPQSLTHPSYSRNLHTSDTSAGDSSDSLYGRIRGSTSRNPHYFGCNTTSFVPLPCVVICNKFKAHVPALDLHELGNMVCDLLLRLFPGFCLNKGLHNPTIRPPHIKPPTHQLITRSPA